MTEAQETLEKSLFPAPETALGRILEQWRVSVQAATGNQVDIANWVSLTGKASYKYVVQPIPASPFHERVDSYLIHLGAAPTRILSFGASVETQITFSRFFPQKTIALKARPLFVDAFPFASAQVFKTLRPGDAARLEFGADGSLGAAFQNLRTFSSLGVDLALHRNARFIAEVYRMDASRVRVRLIGSRNKGSLSGSVSANALAPLGGGLAERALSGLLKCSLFSAGAETSLGSEAPVETFILDDVVNLNQPQGREVYDQTFGNFLTLPLTQGKGLLGSSDAYAQDFWQQARFLEAAFLNDRGLPRASRAVDRLYKLQYLTNFSNINAGSRCLKAWEASKQAAYSNTSLRSYDEDNRPSYQLFSAGDVIWDNSFLFGLSRDQDRLDINALFGAHENGQGGSGVLEPDDLSELVVLRHLQYKSLKEKSAARLLEDFRYEYPALAADSQFPRLFGRPGKKSQLFVDLLVTLKQSAIKSIPPYGPGQIRSMLTQYLLAHPHGSMLPKSYSQVVESSDEGSTSWVDDFSGDLAVISHWLNRVLNPQSTPKEIATAIGVLRKDALFQRVGPSFLLMLIPRNQWAQGVRLSLSAQSDEEPFVQINVPGPANSQLYETVQASMKTLVYQGFDQAVQLVGCRNAEGALK